MTLKNTDNDYIIEVKNTQTIDGAKDVIEERARGRYYERGGRRYIIYDSFSDGGVITTSVIVSDGLVKIRRSGAAQSTLVLSTDRETVSPYHTPYGVWTIGAETETIAFQTNGGGCSLRLKYTLTIQGGKYHNDMTIKVIGDKR